MKRFIFGLFFYFYLNLGSAQNLVPNGSFESFTQCPLTGDKIYYATGWFQPCKWPGTYTVNQSSSSDYFNSCGGPNSFNLVPKNYAGYQNAFTGVAYAGIVFMSNVSNYREYIEIKLTNSLVTGKKYNLKYYVSLLDGSSIASNQFDAYFSHDSLINISWSNDLIIVTPHTTNLSQSVIADTMNWVQLSGSFIANGGENFLTIGNFHPDNLTDTAGVNPSFPSSNTAYYYIDEVSLEVDTLTGIEEIPKVDFTVSPNPTKNRIQINSLLFIQEISILDMSAKTLFQQKSNKFNPIVDLSKFEDGIYILKCRFPKDEIVYKKVVVLH